MPRIHVKIRRKNSGRGGMSKWEGAGQNARVWVGARGWGHTSGQYVSVHRGEQKRMLWDKMCEGMRKDVSGASAGNLKLGLSKKGRGWTGSN